MVLVTSGKLDKIFFLPKKKLKNIGQAVCSTRLSQVLRIYNNKRKCHLTKHMSLYVSSLKVLMPTRGNWEHKALYLCKV